MKKLLILCLTPFMLFAETQKPDFDGYAYIMLGNENASYGEKVSYGPIKSKAVANNYVQMSGGLTRVNESFDFSIDTVVTLLSNDSTEEWRTTRDWYTIPSGTLLQQNSFDIIGSKLKILLHYKMTDKFRIVAGPAYTLDTFKRYNWEAKHPLVTVSDSITEERYASLQGHVGMAYESYMPAYDGLRYAVRATYGHPLWQETKNTSLEYDDIIFSEKEGYNADFDLYAGYTVRDGLEVGLYGGYALQHRSGGQKRVAVDSTTDKIIEWPENDLIYLRSGLMFVWKFRD